MKKLQLNEERAKALYQDASPVERAILEDTFGFDTFNGRPLGVWCLTKDHHAIKPSSVVPGRSCPDDMLGVGVVTDDLAFIVHPGPSVVLPWGSPDVSIDAPGLLDTASVDFDGATRAAAQWCRDLPGGNWHLPTRRVLESMSEHMEQINECMRAFGCNVVTPNCHWSSQGDKYVLRCAFVFKVSGGSVSYIGRNASNCVRAVSAFHFEDFKF